MNKYLIRLNGAPFVFVTCPAWMDPVRVINEYLKGNQIEGVTIESAMAA